MSITKTKQSLTERQKRDMIIILFHFPENRQQRELTRLRKQDQTWGDTIAQRDASQLLHKMCWRACTTWKAL